MKFAYAAAAILTRLALADSKSNLPYPVLTLSSPTYTSTAELSSNVDKFTSNLASYQYSVTTGSDYSAFVSAVVSAADGNEDIGNLIWYTEIDTTIVVDSTAIITPALWTKLPTSAQAFATSVIGKEQSLYNKDVLNAAVATPAPVIKAAAVAGAGAIAGAALLL